MNLLLWLFSITTRWGVVLSPLRDCLRDIRRQMLRVRDQKDSVLDKVLFLSYSLLVPFFATSLFYLEQIKNLALAVILWNSVMDYSGGSPTGIAVINLPHFRDTITFQSCHLSFLCAWCYSFLSFWPTPCLYCTHFVTLRRFWKWAIHRDVGRWVKASMQNLPTIAPNLFSVCFKSAVM